MLKSGVAIPAKSGIKLQEYPTMPRKLLTSFFVFGEPIFLRLSFFLGFILILLLIILETDADLPQVRCPFGGLSVLADIRGFIRWADIRGSDGGYPTRG